MPDTPPPLVIIGAGGTGGHMFPASAFAEEMRARGWRVGLMSDARGLRYGEGFPADWTEEVQAASPSLRRPHTLPGTVLALRRGVARARRRMKDDPPALVAGFGGYPAYPALSAGRALGVPLLVHEQNAVLGRVNRRFARRALVASGFDGLARLPKGAAHHSVGNPVRAPVLQKRTAPYPETGAGLTLLVTGGSQGARILGEAVPAAVAALPEGLRRDLRVVQQVREAQLEAVAAAYGAAGVSHELQTFFSDMPRRLAEAHLVIARSGAGTVSEIAAVGRPAILVPLAIAMDDHQTANAAALERAGAADILSEREFTPPKLAALLEKRLSNPVGLAERAARAREAGRPQAAQALAALAEERAGRTGRSG